MNAPEQLINMLQREKALLEKEVSDLNKKQEVYRDTLFEAIQIINDLLDPTCPEEFNEVAISEVVRFQHIYFDNY
jgi:hypothetical protein